MKSLHNIAVNYGKTLKVSEEDKNTETITTAPKIDHYRTIKPQNFFGFPQGFNPEQWRLYGYLQGIRVNRKTYVTMDCFDSFSFSKFVTNEKGKIIFMEVSAFRIKERSQWTLILEQK